MNMLVAFHEAIEATLCKLRGIHQVDVDSFDISYELRRKPGDNSEPGDDKDAPYRKEHFVATTIERQLANEFAVEWPNYESVLENL